jgi:hypothetical protein
VKSVVFFTTLFRARARFLIERQLFTVVALGWSGKTTDFTDCTDSLTKCKRGVMGSNLYARTATEAALDALDLDASDEEIAATVADYLMVQRDQRPHRFAVIHDCRPKNRTKNAADHETIS